MKTQTVKHTVLNGTLCISANGMSCPPYTTWAHPTDTPGACKPNTMPAQWMTTLSSTPGKRTLRSGGEVLGPLAEDRGSVTEWPWERHLAWDDLLLLHYCSENMPLSGFSKLEC